MNFKLKAIYNSKQLLLLKDQDLAYNRLEEHQEQSEFR